VPREGKGGGVRFCTIDGCGTKHYARGTCQKHYNHLTRKRCSEDGCGRPRYRRGYCFLHDRIHNLGYSSPLKLSVGPLVDFLRRNYPDASHEGRADLLGVSRRRIERWFREDVMLTLPDADDFATRLEVHPLDIWGSAYWTA